MLRSSLKKSVQAFRQSAALLHAQSTQKSIRIRSTANGYVQLPPVKNEPLYNYEPGSDERAELKETLTQVASKVEEIPVVVNGEEYFTGITHDQVMPTRHGHVIARVHYATPDLIQKAISTAVSCRYDWQNVPFEHRAAIFWKAADLLGSIYRSEVVATTMLGQGKNVWQGEIDAAAETIDFFRFDCKYFEDMQQEQPNFHGEYTWNRSAYRGLEGFVAAISPFNFTAIGAHLCSAPVLVGNTVVWKPTHTATLSNYTVFKVLKEAGLPDGIINFVPSVPQEFGDAVTKSPHLAALNFTGSTKTFKHLWKEVAENLDSYRTYPRLVGECGGKNFHLVHESADEEHVAASTVRSAFEYQGQKCSACSRMYVPRSLWPSIKEHLVEITKKVKMGHVEDFSIFMGAVIDKAAFDRISQALKEAKTRSNITILTGGNCDDSEGYFVEPTIIETTDPKDTLMETELFGPVLTVYVYDDEKPNAWSETCKLVDGTSPYALTGAIYSRDRGAASVAMDLLRQAAGNLYINDKSTGSVVGQQPFGGSRLSGTNDKAGAASYLSRFVSPQSIKENTVPCYEWAYPHMEEP